eukprot:GFUD01124097.1.p1 GENE.GFUD01124097.1~~GFUD01124097.1.p1  ORF type:complete len:339 (+),score=66.81 GFUD01124097.1:45-1019(+)
MMLFVTSFIFVANILVFASLVPVVNGLDESNNYLSDVTFGEVSAEDVTKFPVCVTDDDCKDMSEQTDADYRCFQYRCFPWNDQELQGKFRSCKKRSDCVQLGVVEGGDGDDGECFRHRDRRSVLLGICLKQSNVRTCSEHNDCTEDQKCVNGNCGEENYFLALNTFQCEMNDYCEDMLLGNHCCYDFASEILGKRCCDADGTAGVILPVDTLDEDNIDEMNTKISFIAEEEKEDVCRSFPHEVMNKMANCSSFTTSSPATQTISTSTTTTTAVSSTASSSTTATMEEDTTEILIFDIADISANNGALSVGVISWPFISVWLFCI